MARNFQLLEIRTTNKSRKKITMKAIIRALNYEIPFLKVDFIDFSSDAT